MGIVIICKCIQTWRQHFFLQNFCYWLAWLWQRECLNRCDVRLSSQHGPMLLCLQQFLRIIGKTVCSCRVQMHENSFARGILFITIWFFLTTWTGIQFFILWSRGNDAMMTITLNVPSNVSMTRAPKTLTFNDDNIPLANGNVGCLASKLHKTQICKAIRLSIEMLVI